MKTDVNLCANEDVMRWIWCVCALKMGMGKNVHDGERTRMNEGSVQVHLPGRPGRGLGEAPPLAAGVTSYDPIRKHTRAMVCRRQGSLTRTV